MFPDYPFLMTMLRATSFCMRVEKNIYFKGTYFRESASFKYFVGIIFVNCLFFEKMIDVFIFLKPKTF